MNKFFKFIPVAVCAMAGLSFASCSDDDEPTDGGSDNNIVFSNGVPKEVGDMKISTNASGQVVKITEDDMTVVFDYVGATSKAVEIPTDYDMTMKVSWGDSDKGAMFYIKRNAQGFIEYAYEVEHSSDWVNGEEVWADKANEWWFTYNANGQMATMKRTEGNNEVTTITYAGGDITKVEMHGDDGDEMLCTISYTDATHSTPIDNKGGIMLYDDTFRIDMDEMAPAYYAGLLGKGTSHLPLGAIEDEDDVYTFTWTLNSAGLPTKFYGVNKYGDTDEYKFVW